MTANKITIKKPKTKYQKKVKSNELLCQSRNEEKMRIKMACEAAVCV